MSGAVVIILNGEEREVAAGSMLASALLALGMRRFRRSVQGEDRGPLCGMGVCQECRVTVDGLSQIRSCMVVCRDRMRVETE